MNTWHTLLVSYQQRVYKNTLVTVNRQIQQAENLMPVAIISTDASRVDNAILLDSFTSEVALEEPEIRSTDPIIPINNKCTDDALHFVIPRGCEDYDDEGDEIDKSNAIPTASRR
jgi:hypothetical protein